MTHVYNRDQRVIRRSATSGVTLIEILMVLVLIGVMATAVTFSVNSSNRGAGMAEREATLLAIRLEKAASEAMLQGVPAGFVWDPDGYEFLNFVQGAWVNHSVAILGKVHPLDRSLEMLVGGQRRGRYLIRADLLPSIPSGEDGALAPLNIAFNSAGLDWHVTFDGLSARALPTRKSLQP